MVLPYINMNLPRVYTCSSSGTPLPPPSPYHPSGSSQCTSPKHPVSCIKPGLVIHFTYNIIYVPMPFPQVIPPLPSPTESKRLFYTSMWGNIFWFSSIAQLCLTLRPHESQHARPPCLSPTPRVYSNSCPSNW